MKLNLSTKLSNVLSKIRTNNIVKELLKLKFIENDYPYNYLDLTDNKALLSFTPSDRIKIALDNKPLVYSVSECLNLTHNTHNRCNQKIFNDLGYTYEEGSDPWRPDCNTLGTILKTTVSSTGKTYVLFKDNFSTRVTVLNRTCLDNKLEDISFLYNISRNTIKVGRLVSNLLTLNKVEYSNHDIEVFVNLFKSSYDFSNNITKQFEIVKGDDISFWYHSDRYVKGNGILSNSCMAFKDPEVFDIYCKNKNVSMLILYADDGMLKEDGSYFSNTIKGRSLLWNANVLVNRTWKNITFMDRIYTNQDSDIDLFIRYAESNGWYHKTEQTMNQNCDISNGVEVINFNDNLNNLIHVELETMYFENHPYTDTMSFGCRYTLTNSYPDVINMASDEKFFIETRNTSGRASIASLNRYIYRDDSNFQSYLKKLKKGGNNLKLKDELEDML